MTKSESNRRFIDELDHFLRLRTDAEDKEYYDYWAALQNRFGFWFAIIALGLSIVGTVNDCKNDDAPIRKETPTAPTIYP